MELPILLNLNNKNIIFIGGGRSIEIKLKSIIGRGANIKIISPDITNDIIELIKKYNIEYLDRDYQKGDLKGAFLVIIGTNSEEVNNKVCNDARENNVLVYAAFDKTKSDLYNMASYDLEDLSISVSTKGNPLLSKKILNSIIKNLDEDLEKNIKYLNQKRRDILSKDISDTEKKELLKKAINDIKVIK